MDLQAGLGRTVGRRRRLQATATGKADSIMFTSLDIRVTKRRLLLVVALNVAGCTGDAGDGRSLIDRSNSSATADLEDLFSKSLHIGLEIQASSEAEAFANIVDAQLSPDGRFIVALDIVPPYVRVFDSTGVLQTAFVPGGEGPGEARDPVSLTVSNEQVLLVQPGRISWFDYSGELLAERSDLRFWPHSAARGCAGEFLLFGPGPTSTGEIVSLRSIRGPNDAPRAIIHDTSTPELYTRRARPLAGTGELVVLHHDGRYPPETITLSCPDYLTVRVDTFPELAREQVRTSRSGSTSTARPPSSIFTGVAVVDQTPILSVALSGQSRTRLLRVGDDGTVAHYADRSLRLLDALRGHTVLLARSEPVPHLIKVDYRSFIQTLDRQQRRVGQR